MRILAVDDDPIILDLLQNALTPEDNYQLVCCASAEEAINVLGADNDRFDCFLLDIMLPGIDGVELCENIRQTNEHRTTPIIMITASKEPGLMERAFNAGATDFVTKPLDGMELGGRINTASMLNASLLREEQARHTLAEMTAKLKLRFDEPIALDADGVTDLKTMENDLLRMSEGCYAMTLFAVDVADMEDSYQAISPRAFRRQLEQVASAVTGTLDGRPWKLAYAGGGRFAGVLMSRKRTDLEAAQADMQERLSADWDVFGSETTTVPELRIRSLSDQRLWSGRSAGDTLSKAMAEAPVAPEVTDAPMPVEDMVQAYAIAAE